MADDKLLLLTLQRMKFLKTHEKIKILKNFTSVDSLPQKESLSAFIGRKTDLLYNREKSIRAAENDISMMLKKGIKIVSVNDAEYPQMLKEIYNPPFLLYYRGILPEINSLNISIVGTRKATGRALNKAYSLSFDFARSGVSIISGLAAGIDSAAHKGALDGRTYTAAVFGCGVDIIYPASGRKLAFKILDSGGALFSEYPPGTIPSKCNFPERNRIVSAFSEAVVIGEAPIKSGSLITADFALEQGREVYVVDLPSESPAGAGSRMLIEQGASVITSVSQVLRGLLYSCKTGLCRTTIDHRFDSAQTGRFLAARMLAEIKGREISREGVHYRL